MRKSERAAPFFYSLLALAGMTGANASPRAVAPPKAAASPSPASQRAQVFVYITSKAGAKMETALPVSDSPIQWWETSQTTLPTDAPSQFRLVGQALFLSQEFLSRKGERGRKQGFLLANEATNFVAGHLPNEKWLLARIYSGFLLPNLALANTSVQSYPSRQRTLEGAVSAFGNAGETPAQKRVLEWLLGRGGALRVDDNTLDWARGTLASLLVAPPKAPRADLQRALVLLGRMKPDNAKGFAFLRAPLQQRLATLPTPTVSR